MNSFGVERMDIKLGEKSNGKGMVDPLPSDEVNEMVSSNIALE